MGQSILLATAIACLLLLAVILICTLSACLLRSSADCSGQSVKGLLVPIESSRHLMVSAYKDNRLEGGATRVLAIINQDHPMPVACIFCCSGNRIKLGTQRGEVQSVHYGYPYVPADILCFEEYGCNSTHVMLSAQQSSGPPTEQPFLPINNRERQKEGFPVFLTVCMPTMYGGYNNALQFIQTMEVYQLLGVQKVVLYLTSCGRELLDVLQHYVEEGVLEIVPWRLQGVTGQIYLNGQLSVMNECIYRNMYTSKYVLLADMNQLLVPYKHTSLQTMIEELQADNPEASVFQIETHLFHLSSAAQEDRSQFIRPEGRQVPGVDLLMYLYRELQEDSDFHSHKMVVNPRSVFQTAIFEVVKRDGKTVMVPSDVCKIMQIKESTGETSDKALVLDNRLVDLADHLRPRVMASYRKALDRI